MTLRCGCEREGDATVFGEVHECTVDPRPPANLPRFAPSSRYVVPATSAGVASPALKPAQYDGDPDGWTELRPYERVLGPDELED